jgi:hypothetical protein
MLSMSEAFPRSALARGDLGAAQARARGGLGLAYYAAGRCKSIRVSPASDTLPERAVGCSEASEESTQ